MATGSGIPWQFQPCIDETFSLLFYAACTFELLNGATTKDCLTQYSHTQAEHDKPAHQACVEVSVLPDHWLHERVLTN